MKTRGTAQRERGPHPLDNWLFGLALAGVALTLYLTFSAWFGEQPAFCGADSQCGLVQQSRWSSLLGVPIALWGLLTYALLARLTWRLRTRPSTWRATLLVAVVGAGVSWYLAVISLFVIEAVCAYCLASFGMANALLVLLLLRRPAHMPEHAWTKALPTPLGTAVVVVFVLALHYSGIFDPAAGPEKPQLKALAVHLSETGARFYGTYWCPTCQQQKALFEASADRLPYVECTPGGRNGPLSVECALNDIKSYPTWIIGRDRSTGIVTVSELARLSGFAWPPGAAQKK
ncbi:MAG: vitamin K epoxide reductase family protein [Pseudomonadota bacterium]